MDELPGVFGGRVSSSDQNTVRQLGGIEVERVFTDKASGRDAERTQLQALIAYAREGDTIVVHSMAVTAGEKT